MKIQILLINVVLIFASAAIAQPHPSATLTWSWAQGTGDPATGFHIQRASSSSGPYATVATTPVGTLTFTDTSVVVGLTYYYVVTAYNDAGDSSRSTEVACTIPFQIPGSPSGLSGTVK